ncbi:hypothetical protein D3C72_2204330 [compost metagenome]
MHFKYIAGIVVSWQGHAKQRIQQKSPVFIDTTICEPNVSVSAISGEPPSKGRGQTRVRSRSIAHKSHVGTGHRFHPFESVIIRQLREGPL